MDFIWGARGKNWGFRLLRRGPTENPLGVFEDAFGEPGWPVEGLQRAPGHIAVKMLDPEARRDRSGRPLVHFFVAFGEEATPINSVGAARDILWPEVADVYAQIWDSDRPPAL